MTAKVSDVVKLLAEIARPSLAEAWDNVGLMVGRLDRPVHIIMCALDLSPEVCAQAVKARADMVVTHHPAIFKPVKKLTDSNWQTELLLQMAEQGIAVYSAHTNLDSAFGGVSDVLAHTLGLINIEGPNGADGIAEGLGRIGTLPEKMTVADFADRVKKALGLKNITVAQGGNVVCKVAVCGGSGMDFVDRVIADGADTFVTGDVKYHEAQNAVNLGLTVIDAGHQGTEMPVVNAVADKLALRLSKDGYNIKVLVARESQVLKVM